MSVQVQKRLFTVAEYYKMADAGIFSEDDRVELLEGEIVQMTAISSRHAACVMRLNWLLFAQGVSEYAIVSIQNPVRLDERSEPQPDLALLRPRQDYYTRSHPEPEDVFLLVEVVYTSGDLDCKVKLPLYAWAGIPEVWLVELDAEVIDVYRRPQGRRYREHHRYERGQRLAPQAFPELALAVDEILG